MNTSRVSLAAGLFAGYVLLTPASSAAGYDSSPGVETRVEECEKRFPGAFAEYINGYCFDAMRCPSQRKAILNIPGRLYVKDEPIANLKDPTTGRPVYGDSTQQDVARRNKEIATASEAAEKSCKACMADGKPLCVKQG